MLHKIRRLELHESLKVDSKSYQTTTLEISYNVQKLEFISLSFCAVSFKYCVHKGMTTATKNLKIKKTKLLILKKYQERFSSCFFIEYFASKKIISKHNIIK